VLGGGGQKGDGACNYYATQRFHVLHMVKKNVQFSVYFT